MFRQTWRAGLAGGLTLVVLLSACALPDASTTSPLEDDEAAETTAPVATELSGPISVIVDYSPTVSDVGGLMYLLAHPNVEVIAVTLPATGEAGCDLGVEVTLGILAMFEREDVPVACDPEMPAHARSWPPEFLEGHENLTFGLPTPNAVESGEQPSDLIARVAAESDRPVVIYAVAPLTNVARAFAEHADLARDVERIVVMGGAVEVPGNVEGTNAEWNLWVDVPAAASVMAVDVPVAIVPLDATNAVPVPSWYAQALTEADQSEAILYLDQLVSLFPAVTSGFYYLWDELAASVAAGDGLTLTEEMKIAVVEGGPDDGRTIRNDGTSVTVTMGVSDPDAFYDQFLSTLAGSPGS